ncbi:MAG: CHASE domain-containing protein [Bdellovibrionales bacterium]
MKTWLTEFLQNRVVRMPPVSILLLSLSLTALAGYFSYLMSEAELEGHRALVSRRVSDAVDDRLRVYENALLSTRSYLTASSKVTRGDFAQFVEGMELAVRYPGILGIGYTIRLTSDEIEKHVSAMRSTGFPTYSVWPEYPRKDYFSIVFLEPFDQRNQRAFGYDMFTSPERRQAMETARDTGLPALSSRVVLVQEAEQEEGKGPHYGFLLYVPVYRPGAPVATVEQRREALQGFVYSPFRANDLFNQILAEVNRSSEGAIFRVYDSGKPDADHLLYSPFGNATSKTFSEGAVALRKTLAQHEWTLVVEPAGPSGGAHGYGDLWVVLVLGSGVSLLIYLFARMATQYARSLKKSENQIRLIADGLPMMVSYVDPDHRYVFVNRAYEEWFAQSRESFRGQPVSLVLGESYETVFRPLLNRALQGERVTFSNQIRHAALGERYAVGQYIPDVREGGRVAGVVVLVMDVTERKQFEDKLHDEQRVSELVNEVGLSLRAEMNMQALTQKVVDVARELSGAKIAAFFYDVRSYKNYSSKIGTDGAYSRCSLSGGNMDELQKLGMRRDSELFAATFRGEGIVRMDDVTTFPSSGRGSAVRDSASGQETVRSYLAVPVISRSGEILGGLFCGHTQRGIFTERVEKLVAGIAAQAAVAIDNSRLFEEAQAINRVKDEFLATLSHELRTPLNVILGYSELLAESDLPQTIQPYVDAIYRNARTQTQLIADLLDVSAIITGKLSFQAAPVRVQDVVNGALENIRFAANTKGVSLEKELEAPGCSVLGDPTRLQQIVWNLLSNAVKFTPSGGRVRVRTRRVGGWCEIEVEDTGIGIDPDFIPYVFDRFRQEDSSRSRRYGGLGLGLSIAKQLVEMHGGRIEVHNRGKNRGALFTVCIPIAPPSVPSPFAHAGHVGHADPKEEVLGSPEH